MWWQQALSAEDHNILANQGVYGASVIKSRGTDRLIEGKSHAGDTLRGWWRDGESGRDINWQWENRDGWPESVAV